MQLLMSFTSGILVAVAVLTNKTEVRLLSFIIIIIVVAIIFITVYAQYMLPV